MDTRKTCEHCGATFEKPRNVARGVWTARRYCSRPCAGKKSSELQRRLVDIACPTCSTVFRPAYSGIVYCSLECAKQRGKQYRGESHWAWKGGRTVDTSGYVRIRIDNEDEFASMRMTHGYVQEHRLVMARTLGRPLEAHETVHHINGVRDDNRPENLQLRSGRHGRGSVAACGDCGSRNIVDVRL